MDAIALPAQAIHSPQLIIANGADNINSTERLYGYFRKYYQRGAPWTFVVQNRVPHCCLQNAQTLILEWLHAVLGSQARKGTGGHHGYLRIEFSKVVDEWKRPEPSTAFAQEWLVFTRRTAPVAVWKP